MDRYIRQTLVKIIALAASCDVREGYWTSSFIHEVNLSGFGA
jgi:hypothetical protein